MAKSIKTLDKQYEDWFREYGSYVILHRAVPHIADGLKPSQRRVMHSLREMDDGRYNKAAGIVGNTMKYHPHGDASVFETLVGIGQKGFLIDTQGNWGNILTGDSAAAPRYIEARLTPFAKEILFNPKTTEWISSYDGRNEEPVTLPAKFPLLLAQGTEGIAVSLSCKILPHNFQELCHAAIAALKGETFQLLPDFPQGGIMDASAYQDGAQGGKVIVRAKIIPHGKHSLEITEIPFGTTTISVRESILQAESRGKIKIKRVHDMTSESASLIVDFPPDADLTKAKSALYAFSACEVSHSTIGCVIRNGRPEFLTVSELLQDSADRTMALIGRELEIALSELHDAWQKLSLEMLFIETRAYKELEEAVDADDGNLRVKLALTPHFGRLREIPSDDAIAALMEIKIRRISRYDLEAAAKDLENIEKKERTARRKLKFLRDTTIEYFTMLLTTFGKNRERRTVVSESPFSRIDAAEVAISNKKLYWNAADGFVGYSLRKDALLPFEVNDLTDVVGLTASGILRVSRPGDKTFFGENLLDVRTLDKNSEAPVYSMIYTDKASGITYAKRFQLTSGFIRDKDYPLAGGSPDNQVLWLHVGAAAECPATLAVRLKDKAPARIKLIEFIIGDLAIKSRTSVGNQVTKHGVKSITVAKGTKKSPSSTQEDLFE